MVGGQGLEPWTYGLRVRNEIEQTPSIDQINIIIHIFVNSPLALTRLPCWLLIFLRAIIRLLFDPSAPKNAGYQINKIRYR
jgi:hypothetical protein